MKRPVLSNKCTLLYTFVVTTTSRWHIGADTCSSLCMSHVLYHEVHLVANILTEYTLPGKHITGYKCLQRRKPGRDKEHCLQFILDRKCARTADMEHAHFWTLYVPGRMTGVNTVTGTGKTGVTQLINLNLMCG